MAIPDVWEFPPPTSRCFTCDRIGAVAYAGRCVREVLPRESAAEALQESHCYQPCPAKADSLQVADLLDEALCGDAELTFDAAQKYVAAHVGALPDAAKLRLYGLYKAATEGRCSTPKPGMLDFKGRAKWCARLNPPPPLARSHSQPAPS